jgi:hypothetical protein
VWSNCVQLDFIVNCKTVGQNKNIKENKEAPDKSWSVTIANQDTYKSSQHTAFCFQVQALLQDPQGYLGGPGFGSGA